MVWVATDPEGPVGRTASRFELYYLSHPGGGRFAVELDGEIVARLSSRGPEPASSYFVVETDDGPHELRVVAQGRGTVRLFGIVVEREGPGVVVDSLGVNGARVMAMNAWDEAVFTSDLAHRGPDLVVLWYGANAVGDDWYSTEQYEQWVVDAVDRVRQAVPDASCLLVGPPDMARQTLADRGPWGTPPALAGIIEAQRVAAQLAGCGFFDLFAAMGGEGTALQWASQDPPLLAADGIHFTRAGYEALADLLYETLSSGYERYRTSVARP
jgi:lysophospholipase L1-like esterase